MKIRHSNKKMAFVAKFFDGKIAITRKDGKYLTTLNINSDRTIRVDREIINIDKNRSPP